jgi:two-component system, NarL family, sensor kinase
MPHISSEIVISSLLATALMVAFIVSLARDRAGFQLRGMRSDDTGRRHRTRALRITSLLRLGLIALMLGAMLIGTNRDEWFRQSVVLAVYAIIAVWALTVALSPGGPVVLGPRQRLIFALTDVVVLFTFQQMSTGRYLPLLVMGLLPLIIVPQLSWRAAAAALLASVLAFVIAVVQDPLIRPELGWPTTFFLVVVYAMLCATALVVAYVEARHVGEIEALSASREALLAETMSASDGLHRRIAETIHDNALQDLMVLRQELSELALTHPCEEVDRALASAVQTSERLREAIFELHPIVIEQLGLGPALEQLAAITADRSGIAISAHVDLWEVTRLDPILFGVARELLANVVRHSGATEATISLVTNDKSTCLDVVDNGVGLSPELAAHRVAEGHIGLASHRARVEAADGRFTFVDAAAGTHIRVEIPVSEP